MALLGALALILATTHIISVEEALEGFSNQGLLTVGVLFAVAAGINNTGTHNQLSLRCNTGLVLDLQHIAFWNFSLQPS